MSTSGVTPSVDSAGTGNSQVTTTGDHDPISLRSGCVVSAKFYESTRQHVEERLAGLVSNKTYTAKRICGTEFWKRLAIVDRLQTGLCIAHMVSTGGLPLLHAGTDKSNAKIYLLK